MASRRLLFADFGSKDRPYSHESLKCCAERLAPLENFCSVLILKTIVFLSSLNSHDFAATGAIVPPSPTSASYWLYMIASANAVC